MSNNFNIYNKFSLGNFSFDFMGEYILTNNQYFLTKDRVVWGYENKEYVFVKTIHNVNNDVINNDIVPFSNTALEKMVIPNTNHMSTHITLFLSAENIDSKTAKTIKKFKNKRSYKFGFNGWSSFRLILFNNQTKEFLYNSEAKDVIKFYKEVFK